MNSFVKIIGTVFGEIYLKYVLPALPQDLTPQRLIKRNVFMIACSHEEPRKDSLLLINVEKNCKAHNQFFIP